MGAWSGESGDLGSDTEVCKLKQINMRIKRIGISERCANSFVKSFPEFNVFIKYYLISSCS